MQHMFRLFASLVNEYLSETEAAMTKADTGEFLFDDLRELAANHAQQRVEFEKLIPENISLGLFVVSACSDFGPTILAWMCTQKVLHMFRVLSSKYHDDRVDNRLSCIVYNGDNGDDAKPTLHRTNR